MLAEISSTDKLENIPFNSSGGWGGVITNYFCISLCKARRFKFVSDEQRYLQLDPDVIEFSELRKRVALSNSPTGFPMALGLIREYLEGRKYLELWEVR